MTNHSNPAGSHSGHPVGLADLMVHSSVGTPLSRNGIALFPLYLHGRSGGAVAVLTGSRADVTISEQASAEVPTIIAENRQAQPVLLVDGQVVEGGRQTRTLNVSVLLAGHERLPIPVSCVEAGRWSGGMDFRHSGQMVNRRVRRAKHLGVEQSVRARGAKSSDQSAVWSAISHELDALGVASQSGAVTAAADRLQRSARWCARSRRWARSPGSAAWWWLTVAAS